MTPLRSSLNGERRLKTERVGLAGIAGLAIILLAVALAPIIAPASPLEQDLSKVLDSPSWAHPFGTDEFGRDLLSRVIYGGRLSLTTALLASGFAAALGVLVGLVTGFMGGVVDTVLMRIVDFFLALPGILLALSIVAILGPGSATVIIAVSFITLPTFARLVRARTLEVLTEEYVAAAESGGASRRYLIFRTVLPNTLSTVAVQMVIAAAAAVLLEAALSFLGLGRQPPAPSWGAMINDGKSYLSDAPWYTIFPGLAVTLTVLAFDSIGRRMQRSSSPGALAAEIQRGA